MLTPVQKSQIQVDLLVRENQEMTAVFMLLVITNAAAIYNFKAVESLMRGVTGDVISMYFVIIIWILVWLCVAMWPTRRYSRRIEQLNRLLTVNQLFSNVDEVPISYDKIRKELGLSYNPANIPPERQEERVVYQGIFKNSPESKSEDPTP